MLSAGVVGGLTYLGAAQGLIFPLSLVESLAFGALISATDPVSVLAIMKDAHADRTLYNVLFGESIFNDAAAIVLYETLLQLSSAQSDINVVWSSVLVFCGIFVGSTLVGITVAFVVSLILKVVSLKERGNFEASSVIFGPWIGYLISEACSLSGIVSILFCGIFMAKYTYPNLSKATGSVVGHAYSAVAEAFEALVFIFLGMGLFSFELPFAKTGL